MPAIRSIAFNLEKLVMKCAVSMNSFSCPCTGFKLVSRHADKDMDTGLDPICLLAWSVAYAAGTECQTDDSILNYLKAHMTPLRAASISHTAYCIPHTAYRIPHTTHRTPHNAQRTPNTEHRTPNNASTKTLRSSVRNQEFEAKAVCGLLSPDYLWLRVQSPKEVRER